MRTGRPETHSNDQMLEPGFSFGGPLQSILPDPLLNLKNQGKRFDFEPGSDRYWMLEAFKASLSGVGITNPNPAVGCVLVDQQGKEISRGATQAFPGTHAEFCAFEKISHSSHPKEDTQRLTGATAYVTLEPCCHYGNQPPCVDLLLQSKIKRIVVARLDLDSRVCGEGIRKLREAGKLVEVGLLGLELTAWNFSFFAHQILKRPVCILKWAQTLDGQLADDSHHSKWISGPTSRSYTHWLRQRYDAVLVGAQTVLSDHPKLNVRECKTLLDNQPFQQPLPIILDPKGLCFGVNSDTQKTLTETTFNPDRTVLLITQENQFQNYERSWLKDRKNVKVLKLTQSDETGKSLATETLSLLSTPEIQQILGHRLQSVFIEGGSKTLSLFLKAGLADLLHIFIAPVITGGEKNRLALRSLLKDAKRFKPISSFPLGEDTVLEMVADPLYKKLFSEFEKS